MRILQINSVYGVGSTGRIAKGIQTELLARNHEVLTIYGRFDHSSDSNLLRIGNPISTMVHMVFCAFGLNGFGSYFATRKAIKEIQIFEPDLVQIHNIHGYYLHIPMLMKFLQRQNLPIVWTLHDAWLFTGHCAYYSYIKCDKWRTQCYKCPQKWSYPYSLFVDNSRRLQIQKKNLLSNFKKIHFISPSNWLRTEAQDSFLRKFPIEVIHNGINKKQFRKLEIEKNGKFVILGVAKPWIRRKGLQFFVQLSHLIKEDEEIILVGLSKRQMRTLPENIKGIEKTNNIDELVRLYNKADVFVNPTLEDNFPTTNIEALASGTPVITFKTGGSPESIDERTGIVVENKTAQDLYSAICEVRNKGKAHYTCACIERSKMFDGKDVYSKYVDLYEEILKDNPNIS